MTGFYKVESETCLRDKQFPLSNRDKKKCQFMPPMQNTASKAKLIVETNGLNFFPTAYKNHDLDKHYLKLKRPDLRVTQFADRNYIDDWSAKYPRNLNHEDVDEIVHSLKRSTDGLINLGRHTLNSSLPCFNVPPRIIESTIKENLANPKRVLFPDDKYKESKLDIVLFYMSDLVESAFGYVFHWANQSLAAYWDKCPIYTTQNCESRNMIPEHDSLVQSLNKLIDYIITKRRHDYVSKLDRAEPRLEVAGNFVLDLFEKETEMLQKFLVCRNPRVNNTPCESCSIGISCAPEIAASLSQRKKKYDSVLQILRCKLNCEASCKYGFDSCGKHDSVLIPMKGSVLSLAKKLIFCTQEKVDYNEKFGEHLCPEFYGREKLYCPHCKANRYTGSKRIDFTTPFKAFARKVVTVQENPNDLVDFELHNFVAQPKDFY